LQAIGELAQSLRFHPQTTTKPKPVTARQPTWLVICYLAQTSNTPFYILSQAPGVDSSILVWRVEVCGQFQTNRFVGKNVAVASAEVRWLCEINHLEPELLRTPPCRCRQRV
jgi:hypothetical protein